MTQTMPAEGSLGIAECPEPDRRGSTAPDRRRILLAVHSAKRGGAERMALLEAGYLADRFELLVSIPDGPLRSNFAMHGELVDGTETLPLWGDSAGTWIVRSVRTLTDAVRLALLIRRRGVELVLTNSSVCLAPVLAARLAGVPVLVHARDVPKSRLAPLVLALHGNLAQTVIVIADGLTRYFRGFRRTRIVRIPDGIAMTEQPASPAPLAFATPLRLCVIGGLDPRKGQDIAVRSLAQLHERGIEAELELVGPEINPGYAAQVRDEAERLGVSDSVAFVGEVSNVHPHLHRADIVLAPSRGEWTPLVLMEALAHGKPVVAASVGEVSDVVRDREFGLLVAPGSDLALTAAIIELLDDPSMAWAMAARGCRHVFADFRIDSTLEGLHSEIDLLIHRDTGRVDREPRPVAAVL